MFESTRTNISMVKLPGSKGVLDTVMRPPRLVLNRGEALSTPAFSNFTEVLLLALMTGPPKPVWLGNHAQGHSGPSANGTIITCNCIRRGRSMWP